MGKKIAVLFDLDGTLLDTLGDLCDSVNVTMRRFSSPERTKAEVRSFLGNGAADLIDKSLCGGRNHPDYAAALAFFKEYYGSHSNIKTCPYDGVIELLAALKEQEIPCAVVTNKPDAAANELCRNHFGDLILDCVGDREGLARKPDPGKVFDMMKRLDCDGAIFVGDSEVDVLTAKNANIPCICMTWGFRDRDALESVGGRLFCDTARELFCEIMRMIKEL